MHLKVHVKPFSFEGESEREKEEIEKIERAEGSGCWRRGAPRVRYLQVRILNLVHASKGAFTM